MCIKEVLNRIIIRRSRYHHIVGIGISLGAVQRGGQIQLFLCEILLYVLILYWGYASIYLVYLLSDNIHCRNLMMLCQQGGNTKAHIACTSHSYLQILKVSHHCITS